MDWLVILVATALMQAVTGPPQERWPAMLEGFDQIRSQAFEDGRADRLESVYPSGSTLLARDKEVLASYQRRGIDIERMQMNLIAAQVVTATSRRVTMHVTDQLVQARVRLSDGTVRDLPRDRPTRRVIVLSLTDLGWRITEVRQR